MNCHCLKIVCKNPRCIDGQIYVSKDPNDFAQAPCPECKGLGVIETQCQDCEEPETEDDGIPESFGSHQYHDIG